MAYNQYDLQNTSLVKTGILTEMYIPLWYYSSGSSSGSNTLSGGTNFLQKGTQSLGSSSSVSAKLHTLNSNWSPNQKFAFEATIYTNSTGYTSYAQLWDLTTNTAVSGAVVSNTTSSYMTVRSGQFTLTPGHSYGITLYISNGTVYTYMTKASLIAFLS